METIYLIVKEFVLIAPSIITFNVYIQGKQQFDLANVQLFLNYNHSVLNSGNPSFNVELFHFSQEPLVLNISNVIGFGAYTSITNQERITVSSKELLIAKCTFTSSNGISLPLNIQFNRGELRTKIYYWGSEGLIYQSSNSNLQIINNLQNIE